MCTVSWDRVGDGYEVYFSRDEQKTRPVALGPQISVRGERRVIAPTDPKGDGTWIATNDCGLTVCLLNWSAAPPPPFAKSRGSLPRILAAERSAHDAARTVEGMRLDLYPPFTLLLLDEGSEALCYRWSGLTLREVRDVEGLRMMTSSSLDQGMAERARQAAWARRESQRDFHFGHDPGAGPWSVCMHREDAETVSLSHVRVSPGAVVFEYQAGSPCSGLAIAKLTLDRTEPIALAHFSVNAG